MNADEALKLCRLAKAASPAQAVDEYTPELWALALQRERFCDAQEALVELAREQEWLHLSHIVKRIARIRAKRLSDYGALPDPPPGLDPSDTEAYHAWQVRIRRDIADGNPPPKPKALPAAPEPATAPKALRDQLAALRRKTEIREGLDEGETA